MNLKPNLIYAEAERKSTITEIIRTTETAWENEMITDKAYNKILNICAKELYWKYKPEKKEAEETDQAPTTSIFRC